MAKSANRKHLEKALGTATTDAIYGAAREVVLEYMDNDDNLRQLRVRLADLIDERGADDPAVREAVQTVVTASREHDATDSSDESAVAEDTERTQAAEQAVEALEQGSEDAGSQPEPEPTPESSDEVDDPAPVVVQPTHTSTVNEEQVRGWIGDSEARQNARFDQIAQCQQETMVVSATAFASTTTNDDPELRRRVAFAVAIGALAGFIIYLFVLTGRAEWSWGWAIGLPAVTGAVDGIITWAIMHEDGPSATAVASAEAIVARWNNNTAPQANDHVDDTDHVVPGMRPDHAGRVVATEL